jgi:selenide,water dikinase
VFGLAVQGVVDPRRVFRKAGARPGDIAVLSKPLGTGLVTAAGTDTEKRGVIAGMRRINRTAAEVLRSAGDAVHAVTDVTGYGLAGHPGAAHVRRGTAHRGGRHAHRWRPAQPFVRGGPHHRARR